MATLKTYNSTKGVSKTKDGKFEAYFIVKSAKGKSKARFKAYVGRYNTEIEAHKARIEFVKNLL